MAMLEREISGSTGKRLPESSGAGKADGAALAGGDPLLSGAGIQRERSAGADCDGFGVR